VSPGRLIVTKKILSSLIELALIRTIKPSKIKVAGLIIITTTGITTAIRNWPGLFLVDGTYWAIIKLAFIAEHLYDEAAAFPVSPFATELQELELAAIMTVWIVLGNL